MGIFRTPVSAALAVYVSI